MTATTLLNVQGLQTTLLTRQSELALVREVSFELRAGETLALVGESGSGKTLTALSLTRLLARNARWRLQGQAHFQTREHQCVDLLALEDDALRRLRGNQIGMIFQEPMTSLNPVMRIGEQIAESVRLHKGVDHSAALAQAVRALEQVEIPNARQRARDYPHQLSGGMRQRVMIAMAMACAPQLLIADEPTTALDVTVQAQILKLMHALQSDMGMGMLFITHNLGVVAQYANRVAVMYAGKMVEQAPVVALFEQPRHRYTQGLLNCLPGRARERARLSGQRVPIQGIPGTVPSPQSLGEGCAFADRCTKRTLACNDRLNWAWEGEHGHLCAHPARESNP